MGRIFAAINVIIFMYFGIIEGFPNLLALPKNELYQMLCWFVMVLSSIFIFKWELVFGIIIILAYSGFNYVQYIATQGATYWTGYILFIYPVSALFFIIAWLLNRKNLNII
jgi:hypothetical protein